METIFSPLNKIGKGTAVEHMVLIFGFLMTLPALVLCDLVILIFL